MPWSLDLWGQPGNVLLPMPLPGALVMAVIAAFFGSGPPRWLARLGGRLDGVELLIARNPDPDSRLPFLLLLPLAGGTVFRVSGTWPRTSAVYCYPVSAEEWPDDPDVVERVGVRSCVRRGAAIDLVLDRGRENRSQIVFTRARGRDAVFWQSPRTRRQARPNVTTPAARAAGIAGLEITVDSHERYAFRFGGRQVRTVKRALPCGDYGLVAGGRLIASVERKSLADLVASLTSGKLRYALAELAALPRAAVVVEDRYSQVFKLERVRPALVADGLAELQVRWPNVPVVFCGTRPLAEEWTYRFLAAAHVWAGTEAALAGRLTLLATPTADTAGLAPAPGAPEPPTAEVRAWARTTGLAVPARGKLRPEVWAAWRAAHRG
jgi:ERCC4 domain-containing protein